MELPRPKGYTEALDADIQITAEEAIASMIRAKIEEAEDSNGDADFTLTDEDCADLGRSILLHILSEFRPDLIEQA
jgi:hypothetical protein